MTYEEAKAYKQELENKNKIDSDTLKDFDKYGKTEMGLTPDHIKQTPEWKLVKAEYNNSFNRLRNFNEWFIKTFKKEIMAERQNNRR